MQLSHDDSSLTVEVRYAAHQALLIGVPAEGFHRPGVTLDTRKHNGHVLATTAAVGLGAAAAAAASGGLAVVTAVVPAAAATAQRNRQQVSFDNLLHAGHVPAGHSTGMLLSRWPPLHM